MNMHRSFVFRAYPCLTLLLVALFFLIPETRAQEIYQPPLYPLEQYRSNPPEPLLRTVSLVANTMPLEELLREIGRQAELVIVFNTDLVADSPPKSVSINNIPVIEALFIALEQSSLVCFVMQDWKLLIADAADADEALSPESIEIHQGQTVRGQVVDRDSRMLLPGAHVIVLNTDPLMGTTTDLDGYFYLTHVPLGRQNIQVSYIGYEPIILPEILVTSGKEVILDVALKERIFTGEEVVIIPDVQKEQPINDMAIVSARSFSVEETRRYAGGADDPARLASAFAGVTASAGIQDNALIVRGNAPKGILWRLEGVEIPNPNHFAGMSIAGGGGLTLFSNQLLADSDFFTGAFPAEYGNALAGVFDINFRTGNPVNREHTFQVGVMGIDLASEGPFMRGKRASYLFNYRYSTIALLLPVLPTEDVARYQDLSFKISFPTHKLGRFDFWGIGGLDGQKMSEDRDSSNWEYETWDRLRLDLKLGVGAAGMSHSLVLGKNTYLKSTAAYTVNHTVMDEQRLDDALVLQDNLLIQSTNSRLILGSYINHKFSTRHVQRTGVTVQRLFYNFDLLVALDHAPPPFPVALGSGGSTLAQFYTQSRIDLSSTLTANVGIHAQYFALTDRYRVEPRVGFRWRLQGNQAISLGYGMHSQIEELRIYFARDPIISSSQQPNRQLDFTKAHHGVLSYDRKLGEASRLKLELYYQYLFDVPVIPGSSYSLVNFEQDWGFSSLLANKGAGENYGLEITAERFLKDGYYYLMTGSLFKSRYRGGDDIWRDTRFDQSYAVNALFGKEFSLDSQNNLLGINGRLIFMGGKRRSPIDMAASLAQQEVVFNENRAFEDREPGVFVLDVTLTYRRNRLRHSTIWALQIKNLLAAKNVYPDYNYSTHTIDEIQEGFPLPVLSYKIEF